MICDRCPARAAVETILDTGFSLTWCLHHWRAYEEALIPYVVHINALEQVST